MDVAGLGPGAGLVAMAVMAVILFAARPVHEAEAPQFAAAVPAEPAARASAVNEPSASPAGPRASFVSTRPVPSRGAAPVRLRAPGRTLWVPRDLSQSP